MTQFNCKIMRGREWIPAHTSQIEKGDWFKIMDDDDVHEALLDAYYVTNDVTGEGEWKVEAKWFKTE